jgi:hypothetical protein
MPQAPYYAPELTELGSVSDLTLGAAGGFPDACDIAVGSVIGSDPCSGQPAPGGIGNKP